MTPGDEQPATSVKIRRADKKRLDRLQAELTALRGRKVTQQDVFAEILALAEREKQQLGGWRPLSKSERSRLMKIPIKTGDRRDEQHIDEDIYGADA